MTYRVLHTDETGEGRFKDYEAPDTAQAIWQAAQDSSGGTLVAAYELDANGLPVASLPASSTVESG